MTPAALDNLSPEERHDVYKMLRITVEASPDGSLNVTGVLGDSYVSEHQDERLARTQQNPRRRRQANVEVIGIHTNVLPRCRSESETRPYTRWASRMKRYG